MSESIKITPENAPRHVIESWNELEKRGDNQFVTVNYDVLDTLAEQNPDLEQPDWRIPGMHPQNDWAFATQIDLADTINYMFLNRDIKKDGEGWTMTDPENGKIISGSNALMVRTYQHFGEAEDITADQIEALADEHNFAKFLPGIPMAESRREQFVKYAQGLRNVYGGSIRNLIEASIDEKGDLRLINNGRGMIERRLDEEFEGVFTDDNTINDLVFPHNKRVNLTPILIDGRAQTSTTLPRVSDLHKSGAVPDYRIPQAQRATGEIIYMPALAETVDSWTPIEANSRKEAEIRGACAKAVFYLLEKTNEVRANLNQAPYNMAHIDFWKWQMGRELKKTSDVSLPHFTETTAY